MFNPLILYRISHWLLRHKIRYIPTLFQRLNYFFNACDIPPSVIIGKNVDFKHFGLGVVINQRTIIEDDVVIMPHVVIGQHLSSREKKNFEHILIKRGVMIGTGAKIIAKNTLVIDEDASIGANSVILNNVPKNATMVGIPAKAL